MLKQRIPSITDPALKLEMYNTIYNEYHYFRYDSAMVYVLKGLELAKKTGNGRYTMLNTIHKATLLSASGLYSEAEDLIKPLDEETILAAARECGKIVTCEEHSIIGGLGEAVCSLVSEKHPVPVRRVGVNDEFGHSGPAAALLEEMGLCASRIAEVVRETVKG